MSDRLSIVLIQVEELKQHGGIPHHDLNHLDEMVNEVKADPTNEGLINELESVVDDMFILLEESE